MHISTEGPDYGSFDTRSVYNGDQEKEISRNVGYTAGQYEKDSPPEFVVGFELLEINTPPEKDLVFDAAITPNSSGFRAAVSTGNDSKLERARMTWVERKEAAKNSQSGTCDFGRLKGYSSSLEQVISFDTPFDDDPDIVMWLKGFHIDGGQDAWKAGLYAVRVTATGFVLRAESWAGGSFTSLSASWVAFGGDKRVFDSGHFAQSSAVGEEQTERSKAVKFITGTFSKPPTIITGFSSIDMPTSKPGRLESVVKDVTKDGFTWELEHGSANVNNAYFIAIPSEG